MGEKIANVDKFKEVLAKMMENRNNLGDIIANFECEGYKINPDERYTKGILDGIDKKSGLARVEIGDTFIALPISDVDQEPVTCTYCWGL